MTLKFDKNGNLPNDLTLKLAEFKKLFGYNLHREKLIQSLFIVAKIILSFGCNDMYIVGSFITEKKQPNDIDVCFDAAGLDYAGLKQKHPDFFSADGRDKIHKMLNIHLFFYASYDTEMLDWFRLDRNNNKKGIVKIPIKDLQDYDKE